MTGAVIDFNIDRFSESVHTCFEESNFDRRNPAIKRAEESQHSSIEFPDVRNVRRQWSVIYDTSSKPRLMNSQVEAPSRRP